MVDIPTLSAVVAAISVVIGVILTVLELRNLVKTRQTDLVMRLYSTWGSERLQEAREEIMTREFRDYDDAVQKYGAWSKEVFEVGLFFEGIGILLHRKLVDIGLVDDLFSFAIKSVWEKLKPITEGSRKKFKHPQIFEWFEHLYNEMQKRESKMKA
jgi:hypothetical protein